MKKIILISSIVFLSSCINWLIEPEQKPDGKLKIVNKSDRIIRFSTTLKTTLNNNDTLLLVNKPLFNNYNILKYIINPDTFVYDEFSIKAMKGLLENDVQMYYLFDKDTLEMYTWEEIARDYKVLKRVDFDTWEDMEKCNFTITYP